MQAYYNSAVAVGYHSSICPNWHKFYGPNDCCWYSNALQFSWGISVVLDCSFLRIHCHKRFGFAVLVWIQVLVLQAHQCSYSMVLIWWLLLELASPSLSSSAFRCLTTPNYHIPLSLVAISISSMLLYTPTSHDALVSTRSSLELHCVPLQEMSSSASHPWPSHSLSND